MPKAWEVSLRYEGFMNLKETLKTTERGWAGHFICADRCRFRRNTLIEFGIKKVVVSTVGDMVIGNEQQQIGLDRYYETMSFEAQLDADGYWDADVTKPVVFDSEWCVTKLTSESDAEANQMHNNVVSEISNKLAIEPVKYSVDVWLNETPKARPNASYLTELLFGQGGYFSRPFQDAKKYRVTVEEVTG